MSRKPWAHRITWLFIVGSCLTACSQPHQEPAQSQPSGSAVDRMSEQDAREAEKKMAAEQSGESKSSPPGARQGPPRRNERDQPAAGIRR